mgnify:CR=1 FL=1
MVHIREDRELLSVIVGYIGGVVSESYYCVFFQAEDGIRDLVRSRGLGDVYKRQTIETALPSVVTVGINFTTQERGSFEYDPTNPFGSVSYTHLTLPTSDLV